PGATALGPHLVMFSRIARAREPSIAVNQAIVRRWRAGAFSSRMTDPYTSVHCTAAFMLCEVWRHEFVDLQNEVSTSRNSLGIAPTMVSQGRNSRPYRGDWNFTRVQIISTKSSIVTRPCVRCWIMNSLCSLDSQPGGPPIPASIHPLRAYQERERARRRAGCGVACVETKDMDPTLSKRHLHHAYGQHSYGKAFCLTATLRAIGHTA
ncbi:hypothetical protein R3P38DRAFT_2956337, partial [Favolaschia claudopus]